MGNRGSSVLTKQLLVMGRKEKKLSIDSDESLPIGAACIDNIEVTVKDVSQEIVVVHAANPNDHRWPRIKVVIQGVLDWRISWKGRIGKAYNKKISIPFYESIDFSTEKDYLVERDYKFDYQRLFAEVETKVEDVSHQLLSPLQVVNKGLINLTVSLQQFELNRVPINDTQF